MNANVSSALGNLRQQVHFPTLKSLALGVGVFLSILSLMTAPYIWNTPQVYLLCLFIFVAEFPLCIKYLMFLGESLYDSRESVPRKVQLFVTEGMPEIDAVVLLLACELPTLQYELVRYPPSMLHRHEMPFLRDGNTPYYGLNGINCFVENELRSMLC